MGQERNKGYRLARICHQDRPLAVVIGASVLFLLRASEQRLYEAAKRDLSAHDKRAEQGKHGTTITCAPQRRGWCADTGR